MGGTLGAGSYGKLLLLSAEQLVVAGQAPTHMAATQIQYLPPQARLLPKPWVSVLLPPAHSSRLTACWTHRKKAPKK